MIANKGAAVCGGNEKSGICDGFHWGEKLFLKDKSEGPSTLRARRRKGRSEAPRALSSSVRTNCPLDTPAFWAASSSHAARSSGTLNNERVTHLLQM
jgi:hypothetical protein